MGKLKWRIQNLMRWGAACLHGCWHWARPTETLGTQSRPQWKRSLQGGHRRGKMAQCWPVRILKPGTWVRGQRVPLSEWQNYWITRSAFSFWEPPWRGCTSTACLSPLPWQAGISFLANHQDLYFQSRVHKFKRVSGEPCPFTFNLT